MPIYEYVCDDCGAHYERIVFHQKTRVTCPKCESAKHTIQLSVFAAPSGKTSGGGSPMSGNGGGANGGGGCCGGSCGCH